MCVWGGLLFQSEAYAIKRSNTLSNRMGQSTKVDEGAGGGGGGKANPCRLTQLQPRPQVTHHSRQDALPSTSHGLPMFKRCMWMYVPERSDLKTDPETCLGVTTYVAMNIFEHRVGHAWCGFSQILQELWQIEWEGLVGLGCCAS